MNPNLIWRNAVEFKRDMEKADKDRIDAGRRAVKTEGYRLSTQIKKDVNAGNVAGRTLAPLSEIAARLKKRRKPLAPLSKIVRYNATTVGGRFNVEVGFVDWGRGGLSKSWKRIAQRQQEGFTSPIAASRRAYIIRRGAELGRRAKSRKYFFLKKSTTQFKTPARPIIDPFWDANRSLAERNIQNNFERKMRGETIYKSNFNNIL